ERAGVLDELDDLEKNSVDFYAQMRSLWQQHREAELRHGKAPEAAPGLYDDPGKAAAGPAKPGAAAAGAKQIVRTVLPPSPTMTQLAAKPPATHGLDFEEEGGR